jgi:hypothetical protein
VRPEPLSWSHQFPQEEGWYWCRSYQLFDPNPSRADIVHVSLDMGHLAAPIGYDGEWVALDVARQWPWKTEWAGPISEPEEPQ